MAQYDIRLREISAEMLDELADFMHAAWGRTDILEVEVIPGQPVSVATGEGIDWAEAKMEDSTPVAVPDPIPASPTGSIEIVLPPEPVEDYADEVPATKSTRRPR